MHRYIPYCKRVHADCARCLACVRKKSEIYADRVRINNSTDVILASLISEHGSLALHVTARDVHCCCIHYG